MKEIAAPASTTTQAIREARIAAALGERDRVALYQLLRTLMRAFPMDSHRAPTKDTEPEA